MYRFSMGSIMDNTIRKKIKAVSPYEYPTGGNFKIKPYNAWKNIGGAIEQVSYPHYIHRILYKWDLFPTFFQSGRSARLCFVQPYSLYFDTWHSAMFYEIIPLVWDCWEEFDDKLCSWIRRHNIRRCVFTSQISAERIKQQLPFLNILVITEGIDTDDYDKGELLINREIDLYYYGRQPSVVNKTDYCDLNVLAHGSNDEFYHRIKNAKVTIAVPRCDVLRKCHETLTQRYWECMLSRNVMVGRAPRELTELIGYNPVIDIDYNNLYHQIKDITSNIEKYQSLVDRNRATALRLAPWEIRMRKIMDWLEAQGYQCMGGIVE